MSVGSLLSHKDAHSIHPAVLQLGLRYADGTIRGATARCVAMLHTFCQVGLLPPLMNMPHEHSLLPSRRG